MNKMFYKDDYGIYIFPFRICTKNQLNKMYEDNKVQTKYLKFYHQFKLGNLYFFVRK